MAKQLNVDMNIKANTSQAQAELKKLQQTLNDAINNTIKNSGNMPLTKEISEATQAAARLKVVLAEATDIKTGKLDLSKFSESLNKSKTSLKEYSNQLLNLGPSGEKAFMQMANAISSAELPLKRSHGLLTNLWTTMKNTARWQLSSSAIKGFTGAISGAYHYAQDLNKSLNNIRIVTGQTTEQMSKFALEANKAAQSLSTTTTAYTDAALIYYQQGLSDEAVKKRTETTIKLANVSRQSAEEVSSQMTAIWNNFAKGSQNLEYYADVITALGAATASSSDEIAEGLSKFAAVADTVGLSYEKASASLATVVAETRQSADVVGTAFKTIFARMEGLNLGKTLEDGTTLNKYSEALEKVGVNIKDQSGELKSMDTILDNIGAKWETLNKDQQIALAQTVAGVRQYTQFIALMDNYDKVQKNQDIAKNSKGTIQKQADIYAESWEASSKRVKAAAQGLYDQLLNDEFFIKFNDALTGLINGIGKFTKSLGGVPGLLGLLGTVATTVFKDQIAASIDNAIYNLSRFTGIAEDQAKKRRQEMKDVLLSVSNPGETSAVQQAENKLMSENFELNDLLAEKKEKLLKADYEELKVLTEITQQYGEYAVNAAKAVEAAEEKTMKTRKTLGDKWANDEVKQASSEGEAKSRAADARINATTAFDSVDDSIDQILNSDSMQKATQSIKEFQDALNNNTVDDSVREGFGKVLTSLIEQGEMIPSVSAKVDEALKSEKAAFENNLKAQQQYQDAKKVLAEYKLAQQDMAKIRKGEIKDSSVIAQVRANYNKAVEKASKYLGKEKDISTAVNKLREKAINTEKKLENAQKKVTTSIKGLTKEELQKIKVSNNAEQIGDQIVAQLLKEGTILEDDVDIIRKYIKEKLEVVDAENQAEQANDNYNQSLDNTKKAIKDATSEMKSSFGKGVTDTFRGISSLSMGISALKGAFDTLNNTDMSFGEKFLSVMTSLGMAIPSIIGGFTTLSKGLSTVKAGFLSGAKAIALHLGVAEADIAAEEGLSLAKIASAINTKLSKESTDSDTESKGANTAATVLQTIANWGLLSSMPPLLAITLAFVAALVALAAIVLIVVSAVNAISDAYNADATAAKNAEEAAKGLAEAYETCKQKYEALKQSVEDHQNAVDSLDKLTKGTQEWRQAMMEANAQALELINSYGLIKDEDYTIDKDGVIRLNETSMDSLLDQEAQKMNVAAASSAAADARAKQARAKSDLTDLKRSQIGDGGIGGAFAGSAIAGAIGGPFAGLVTAIGGLSNSFDKMSQSNNAIDSAIARLTTGDLSEQFKGNQLSDEELKQKLQIDDDDLLASIKELSSTINANTNAVLESNKQLVAAEFEKDSIYKGSKYQEDLNVILAKQLANTSDKKYEEKYKSGKGISDEDAQKAYAKAMGYTWSKNNTDDKAGEFIDQQTKETISMNNEAIRQYLAQQDALSTLGPNIQELNNVLNKLHSTADGEGDASIASQALLSKMTKGDFSNVELTNKKESYSQADLQGSLSDEEFKTVYSNLGYDSAEAFVTGFNAEMSEKMVSVADVINSIEISDEGIKQQLAQTLDGLTAEEGQNIANSINKLVKQFGKGVGTNFADTINTMSKRISKASEKERKFLTKQLGKITDATDAKQWDSFAKTLKKTNDVSEKTKKEFLAYIKTAKDVANATKKISFDEFIDGMKEAKESLDKIADGNRDLTKEEYENLVKRGAQESDFIRTMTGDYQYIGSMASLLGDIEKQTEEEFQSSIDAFIQSGEAALQSAENACQLTDAINEQSEAEKTAEEEKMSEWEKFVQTIQGIWEGLCSAIQTAIQAVADFFSMIWGWIKDNIIDPIATAVNAFCDGIIMAWNGVIDAVFGLINGIIGAINSALGWLGVHIDELDSSSMKGKTSKEREEEERKKKEAEAAQKQAQSDHEAFVENAKGTKDYITANGANISDRERKTIEDQTLKNKQGIQAKLAEAQEKLNSGSLTSEQEEYYKKLKENMEEELKLMGEIDQAWHKVDLAAIQNATNLQELNDAVDQARTTGEVDYNLIAEGLKKLAENYDNCTQEVSDYEKALASGSSAMAEQAEQALRNAIAIGEMSKALDLESENVEEQAKELISVNKLSKEQQDVATKIAVLNQSMNKGLSDLVDNWEEYKNTLKTAQKGSQDYADAALKTKKSLAQLLGVLDEDYIPADFLEMPGVMDLIDQAANGSTEAINKLGASMAKATVDAMEFEKGMKGFTQDGEVKDPFSLSRAEFDSYKNEVLEGITALTESIENGTVKAGQNITEMMDGTGKSWVDSLNQMAYATGMSVDEMNSLLNELGVQTDVTTVTKEVETSVPEYTTYETTDPSATDTENTEGLGKGWKVAKKSVTVQTGTKKVKGTIDVAQINTGEDSGKPPTITYAGRDNAASSVTSKKDDSSSSSGNHTSAASHSHEVNRYSDEENAINGLSKQYERLGKAKDQAFGAGVIQAMELELKKLKELKDASSNYLEAIVGNGNAEKVAKTLYSGGDIGSLISSGQLGGTIAADYRSLFSGASASGKNVEYTAKDSAGNEWLASTSYNINDMQSMFGSSIGFQLDSYGNITNKDSILNELQRLTNSENDNFAQYSNPDAASTTEHNKRLAYLEEIKSRVEQYGTTVEDLSTQADAYLDYISQIQEKNAELISTKLNTGITLSNNTLTRLERAIKILGDDIYKSTEKMVTWFDTKLKSNRNEYQEQAKLNEDAMADIQERVKLYQENPLDENAISPAKAAELAQSIEENYASLYEKAINDITEMEEQYGNTLDKWKEKISEVTTSIDFNIEKLSHLRTVFELLGEKGNYEKLGYFLQKQAIGAETRYSTAKDSADKARELYAKHEAYSKTLTEKELEEYKKDVLAKDQALIQEWEQEEQSSFQSWIEALQAIHDNNINKIYQQFEDNLTGEYGSFSNLDASMQRQQSITDEYLTKTNQLYETNKMLRNLQQDIDKTDNRMAKEKLKAFFDEINSMKEKEKLSKTDLELAKSKYEVLKAQIALEEAQNAKSTVRLQRDNEGNYGYIYTADQDKVANAEQDLADKQNAYYNLALEQANDFSQKLAQIGQEYSEARKKLDQDRDEGLISEEQYQQSLIELQDYYKDLELRYLEGYNTAAGILDEEAAQGRIEAWGTGYEGILNEQRLFNNESTGAAQELNSNLQIEAQDWKDTQQALLQEAGLDNENYKQTVDDVTKEIKTLGDQITKDGGLVDQFGSAADITEKLTRNFVDQYEALLNEANGYLEAANGANQYCTELMQLTNQQLQYNAAVAAQPTAVHSGNGSAGYSNSADGDSSSNGSSKANSSTTNGIEDRKPIGYRYKNVDVHYVDYSDGITQKERHTYVNGICDKCGFDGGHKYLYQDEYYHYADGTATKKKKPGSFSSGGYTGSWDGPDLEDNGKLAFLHQKELVLNATDTENMLNAIKLIRQISQTIDLQAATQSSALSLQAAQFSNNGQVLQQEVTIHAEFPNATNHNEIEEAFNNLVNRASQFASRQ